MNSLEAGTRPLCPIVGPWCLPISDPGSFLLDPPTLFLNKTTADPVYHSWPTIVVILATTRCQTSYEYHLSNVSGRTRWKDRWYFLPGYRSSVGHCFSLSSLCCHCQYCLWYLQKPFHLHRCMKKWHVKQYFSCIDLMTLLIKTLWQHQNSWNTNGK